MELQPIGGLLLRRAVLGILLAAGGPLTAAEVAELLHRSGATTRPALTKGPSRVIADLLAYQARLGRVEKRGPATFAVVPASMSRSTRRRCLRWQLELADLCELIGLHSADRSNASDVSAASDPAEPPAHHLRPGSPLSDAPTASERGEPTQRGGHLFEQVHGSYPAPMITVEAASSADLAELTDQGAALFTEDAGRYDTYIDLTWSQRQGRVDFERLIGDPGSLVLVARVEGAVVGHLVGYTHEASANSARRQLRQPAQPLRGANASQTRRGRPVGPAVHRLGARPGLRGGPRRQLRPQRAGTAVVPAARLRGAQRRPRTRPLAQLRPAAAPASRRATRPCRSRSGRG